MDELYRSFETSLLGFSLLLAVAVATLVAVTRPDATAPLAITLPMIEVHADR